MHYPAAYCVRCKSYTDTMGRHTIVLSNKRRALKGVCPVCATETYRIMPDKKREFEEDTPTSELALISSQRHLPNFKTEGQPATASAVPVFHNQLDPVSQVEYQRFHVAQRFVSYGLLLTVLGLSVAIGFMLCVVLFRR